MSDTIINLVDKFGVSFGVIFAMFWALLHFARWANVQIIGQILPMVKAWGERMVLAHEQMVQSAVLTNASNSETLRKISTDLMAQTAVLHRVETSHGKLLEVIIEEKREKKKTQKLDP